MNQAIALRFLGICLFLLLLGSGRLSAQNADAVIDQLGHAIQKGDASAISDLMSDKVEMTMPPNTDGEFSRNQSLFILREFFMSFPVQSFAVLVRGNNDGTHYAMGKYVSSRGKFDVNIFLRKTGSTFTVYQIRFDQTN